MNHWFDDFPVKELDILEGEIFVNSLLENLKIRKKTKITKQITKAIKYINKTKNIIDNKSEDITNSIFKYALDTIDKGEQYSFNRNILIQNDTLKKNNPKILTLPYLSSFKYEEKLMKINSNIEFSCIERISGIYNELVKNNKYNNIKIYNNTIEKFLLGCKEANYKFDHIWADLFGTFEDESLMYKTLCDVLNPNAIFSITEFKALRGLNKRYLFDPRDCFEQLEFLGEKDIIYGKNNLMLFRVFKLKS